MARRSRNKAKGIFCLEGDWWGKLKKHASLEPVLGLLTKWDPYYVPYVRRDVATKTEFEHYLRKWTQKQFADYPILYLAFHGNPGVIYGGDRNRDDVTLDEIEKHLRGKCKSRIIYFGSCGTINLHGHRINRFLRETKALAVCGYKEDVDWITAAAFEIIVFSAMQEKTLTVNGAKAIRKMIKDRDPFLVKKLNFRMVVRNARW